jgi:hypothetical protein
VIVLRENTVVVRGATLTIEPGVEVRMHPGVSLIVEGRLDARGVEGRRVRFTRSDPSAPWEALVADSGGQINLYFTDLLGGGAGGKVLQSTSSSVNIQNTQLRNNSGQIWALNSHMKILSSEITENRMPYGAAVEISYNAIGEEPVQVEVLDSRIHHNQLSLGAPPLKIVNNTPEGIVNIHIQTTLLAGQSGPDLEIMTDGPVGGSVFCNTLIGGANGLSVRTEHAPPTFYLAFSIRSNVIDEHEPGNNPTYQQLSIGRGATSDLRIDMRENWWGDASGPYAPDRNTTGKGDAVGVNIAFDGWLMQRPSCAK